MEKLSHKITKSPKNKIAAGKKSNIITFIETIFLNKEFLPNTKIKTILKTRNTTCLECLNKQEK